MSKHCSPRNTTMPSTVELSPDILLFHILPRLPANSLRRFRFVSKQWSSFITTPVFAQMHLHHQNQNQNHHKLLLLFDSTFRTMDIDCENPNKVTFTFANVHLPFNAVDYKLSVLKSLHGMVLCGRIIKWSGDYTKHSDLILWNPVTGDYKTLSKSGSDEEYSFTGDPFGLYYSYCDNSYKILRITAWHKPNPNVYVYSLKTDSWRKVESSSDFQISYYNWFQSTNALLNEKLYFLVNKRGNYEQRSYSIIRFDTKTEKFTQIATPFPGNVYVLRIVVLRGCILYFHKSEGGIELWRMDGDGDGEYWTKVGSLLTLWLDLVPWWPEWVPPCFEEPLHLTGNEKLFTLSRSDHNLYQLDVKKDTRKRLCALPKGTTILDYMETIVSPNQYTN